jgi:polar amino acid transport system substrate-binding protein
MKSHFSLRLLVLSFLFLSSFSLLRAQESELPDLEQRIVTIAVETLDHVPFSYTFPGTDERVGWDYDTLREICIRLNCIADFEIMDWADKFNMVRNDEIDVAASGIAVTEELLATVDSAIPLLSYDVVLLGRARDSRFSSLEEFIDNDELLLGVTGGWVPYLAADEAVEQERLITFRGTDTMLEALLDEEVDGLFIIQIGGLGYQGSHADEVRIVGHPATRIPLTFVFPTDSDLIEPFNAALMSMIDDGEMAEINARWGFPADMTDQVLEYFAENSD